ncbi:hypothetical protein K9M79_04050 [Candidatus Woesearchaeota archaeon]|nr:hypothetical protein [Candidatus Woesearchaeota archaeon]
MKKRQITQSIISNNYSKRIRLFFIPICLLTFGLLLTGCQLVGGGDKDPKALTLEDIRVGTDGLVVNFLEKSPPAEMYESTGVDTPISIGLELTNVGAFDAETYFELKISDKIALSDSERVDTPQTTFDLSGFGEDSSSSSNPGWFVTDKFSIPGKTLTDPRGGFMFLRFPAEVGTLAKGFEFYDARLTASVCYSYKTIATPTICIDPDLYQSTTKACESKEVSLENQGAPIAVKKVNPISQKTNDGVRVILEVEVANVGGGSVFYGDSGNNIDSICKGGEIMNSYSYVVRLNGKECKSDKGALMTDLTSMFRCTFDFDQSEAFSTPVEIELDYGYQKSFSKTVHIKSLA